MDKITLERKIRQAYELAGCARQDRDTPDELRWLKEARRLEKLKADLPD